MTTEQFIKQQEDKLLKIAADKPFITAVKSITALQYKRIFKQGLNASGSLIGNYSNNPLYVSLENSPRKFQPKGKPPKPKDIKDRKSGYFANYLTYKKAIGRNQTINSVDLFLNGELQRDFLNSKTEASPEPKKKGSNVLYFSLDDFNYKKVEKYGNVFGLTSDEISKFVEILKFETIKALK